jgi:nitrite reductase (NADH) large subunit
MKVVIIGNGVAGIFSAQHIRSLDKDLQIEIYSQESYPYYTRIKLPELISEKVIIDDIIVFKEDWYQNKKIKTYLNKKVERIDPEKKQISINNSEIISYDKLIIATGSMPNVPPIKNAKELISKGVFTLRNIDDALEIREYIKSNNIKKAVIIGGGLLGLELSRQIKNCDLETTVVEFFPRLLPRQLDVDCGGMLKEQIENMGINVELDAATEEIVVNGLIEKIKIKDGREIKADMVLIQAGIRPTIELAEKAGLETDRGIIVNEYLQTSNQDIFAVGDCMQFKNQTWGIIPACLDQAKIVAKSILGKETSGYKGTVPKNTLKIVGIDLTSVGIYDPEDKDLIGAGWEIMKNVDKQGNCYKKIVLKENKLKGAILFGDKGGMPYVNKNIEKQVEEAELREAINLYKWKCGCGAEYDDAKNEVLFKDLPDDWKCPKCGGPKSNFKKVTYNV